MSYWAKLRDDSPEDFLPLAVELFGGWHPESVAAISRMIRMAASRFWQRLSVLVHKGVRKEAAQKRFCAQPHSMLAGRGILGIHDPLAILVVLSFRLVAFPKKVVFAPYLRPPRISSLG